MNAPASPATTEKPLWKVFLLFLGPMMVANILQALSGTINNAYLGQMLGVGALAAASSFFPVLFFLIAFLMGMGSGTSVLIGQAWGAGNHERVRAIAGTAITVTVLSAVVVAIFGALLADDLMRLLATPQDILPDAIKYARIMLIAAPAIFLFFLVTSILRGVGDTVTPLWTLLISTVIGLVMTPALLRGWGGLPQMGVASAACATIVSMLLSTLWLAFHLRRKNHPLAPTRELWRHMQVDPAILRAVLRLALPTAMQMVVMSIAELVLLGFVNNYGSDATAAYGAVNQVLSYSQFPAMSIAITASILGAQAIGAGRPERLGSIVRTGLLLNLVLTGALVAVTYAISRSVLGVFLTSPSVVDLAQNLLHIVLWSSVVFGMAGVLSGIMRASGAVLVPTAISMFVIVAIEVPSAWLLSKKFGIDGIWAAYPIAFCSMLLLQGLYYRLIWRRQRVVAIELATAGA